MHPILKCSKYIKQTSLDLKRKTAFNTVNNPTFRNRQETQRENQQRNRIKLYPSSTGHNTTQQNVLPSCYRKHIFLNSLWKILDRGYGESQNKSPCFLKSHSFIGKAEWQGELRRDIPWTRSLPNARHTQGWVRLKPEAHAGPHREWAASQQEAFSDAKLLALELVLW